MEVKTKYKLKVQNIVKNKSVKDTKPYELQCEIAYDILIPIYNAFEEVKNCIASVLKYSGSGHIIYLLDDASTDERIIPLLKEFKQSDKRIILLESQSNQGFIKNINRGFQQSKNNVIILNSDTEVTPNWIERMHRCAYSGNRNGVVTPLSNNATIFSVPNFNEKNDLPEGLSINEFAEIVAASSYREYPEVPTGGGFCMLIKREVLDKVGFFDTIFGMGYGEENDFCERVKNEDYKLVCADDTFIYHHGKSSFIFLGDIDERRAVNRDILIGRWPNYQKEVFEFCRRNPLRPIQERITKSLTKFKNQNAKHILYVMHNYGNSGGTELQTKSIIEGLKDDFRSSLMIPYELQNDYKDALSTFESDFLRVIGIAKENTLSNEHFINHPGDLSSPLIEENFTNFLSSSDYDIVVFQHLLGWSSLLLPLIAKELGKKVIISIKDYYLLCPEFNMIFPGNNKRCNKSFADWNDNECIYCLSSKRLRRVPQNAPLIQDYAQERYELISYLFSKVDRVLVHSEFVKNKFLKSYGNIISEKMILIPHGVEELPESPRPKSNKKLQVGFLGNASDRKGILVLLEAANTLKDENISFKVFGNVPDKVKEYCHETGVTISGNYNKMDLPNLFSKIDLALIPSIVDETFSHTLSETFSMKVPVLASDAGALGERIVDGQNGFLFETGNHHDLVAKLKFINNNRQVLDDIVKNQKSMNLKSIKENIDEYRNLYKELITEKTDSKLEYSISLIILSYNGKDYLEQLINSIEQHTNLDYELILVDNNSDKETNSLLKDLEASRENIKVVFNDKNYGFPEGINIGLKEAAGEYIVLLNNDVVVTDKWLENMIKVADTDPQIGIVGPISNKVSGVQVDKNACYESIEEMHVYAESVAHRNKGKVREFPRVAFLCTLIKKELIDKIGGLDERFSPGNFEDDDFCLRAQVAGYKTVIADEVFIHHYGSISFKENGEDQYSTILKQNEQKFIDKWGSNIEGIWLRGEKINNHSVEISINRDRFIQYFERSFRNIEDNEYDLALMNLKLAIENYHSSERIGYENISLEDLLNISGNIALSKNDLEEAKHYFEKQLEENPNSSNACFGLAEVFNMAEMYQESKTMLEWALNNDPENTNAINKLTEINRKLNLPENHNSLIQQEMA